MQNRTGSPRPATAENLGYEEPTRIASASAFVKGAVNLRRVIVPIVDRRVQFELDQANYDRFKVVILRTVGRRLASIAVDGISDVVASRRHSRQVQG